MNNKRLDEIRATHEQIKNDLVLVEKPFLWFSLEDIPKLNTMIGELLVEMDHSDALLTSFAEARWSDEDLPENAITVAVSHIKYWWEKRQALENSNRGNGDE